MIHLLLFYTINSVISYKVLRHLLVFLRCLNGVHVILVI